MIGLVAMSSDGKLPELTLARYPCSRSTHALNGDQAKSEEQRHDRDDNKEFEEGKPHTNAWERIDLT